MGCAAAGRGVGVAGEAAMRAGDGIRGGRGAAERPCHRGARGQATVETIALAPLIIVIGLALLQLLAVGYASVLAGNAAEAGALALAAGTDGRAGAKQALPGWSRARARVEVEGGRVEVHLRPPSPIEALADGLEVSAAAAVEAP
jgi:hypothetical protein